MRRDATRQTHLNGIVAGETFLVLLIAQNDERTAELVEGNATGKSGHDCGRFGHGLRADAGGFLGRTGVLGDDFSGDSRVLYSTDTDEDGDGH